MRAQGLGSVKQWRCLGGGCQKEVKEVFLLASLMQD